MATIDQPLFVDGAMRAGNIAAGRITVPVPGGSTNSLYSATVTGLSLVGSGNLFVQVTPWTTKPGGRQVKGSNAYEGVIETAVSNVSSTGFIVWIQRTTDVDTVVLWFATRNP